MVAHGPRAHIQRPLERLVHFVFGHLADQVVAFDEPLHLGNFLPEMEDTVELGYPVPELVVAAKALHRWGIPSVRGMCLPVEDHLAADLVEERLEIVL